MTVADPGNAMNDWGFNTSAGTPCCNTPATAYPVGIVDQQNGYVQGNIDPTTGVFFYVFRTGPAFTELDYNGGIQVQAIHLHEATGLIFGAEVPPIETDGFGGRWTVAPDTVYVLELIAPGGGFF